MTNYHNLIFPTENIEEKTAKIEKLIVYVKQLRKPHERITKDIKTFLKTKYPSVRCDAIDAYHKLSNSYQVIAVSELISLRGFDQHVASDLGFDHLVNKVPGGVPWLTEGWRIRQRERRAPVPVPPILLPAVAEVEALLQTLLPGLKIVVACAICYDDFDKKDVISCCEEQDAHSVCFGCIRGQARALCTDGRLAEGGKGLLCVEPGCQNVLLWAVVKRILDDDVARTLEKRIDNEALIGIQGLESCKNCDYQMFIEECPNEMKVFSCGACRAEFCRECKVDWRIHVGKRCEELRNEEDERDRARKELEERLAQAIMRECHRCHIMFTKEAGCNKMTCVCGATQCYVCRAQNVDYNHFCNHVIGQNDICPYGCRCQTFTDQNAIDRDAINRVRQQFGARGQ